LSRRRAISNSTHGGGPANSNGLLRSVSEQLVLDAILEHGPVSRADVAKIVGLSKPTVSSVVSALETCGLVRVCGNAAGAVGRPAVLYEIDGRAGFVFGVDLGGTNVRVGLTDLYGVVINEVVEPTHGRDALRQIGRMFHNLIARTGVERELVRGGAVGLPGVFHPATGTVSAAYNVPLEGIDVASRLRDELGIPLIIDNDVNLAAVGERWRGLASGCDNFVAMSIGTGIGMGIVINGEIYAGAEGAAGEIGFLPIGVDDPFDPDHQIHGPFESAASAPGLLAHLHELLDDGTTSSLDDNSTLPQAFRSAASGDPIATQLVQHEGRLLALAIAAVSSILDPELVVLGGGIGANRLILPAVRRYVAGLLPRPPRVEVSALGERAALYGAIAAGLGLVRDELLKEVAATAVSG
jgi:predicted NBD/HSP70 family sugar kinase